MCDCSSCATVVLRNFLRRKWRLLIFACLLLLATELVAVRLWDEFYPVQPSHPDRSAPSLTPAQEQSAVDLVQASGIVDRISGGQAWEVAEVSGYRGNQRVNVYVEWDNPVESSGPWLTSGAPKWLGRNCRNVRSKFHVTISNIRFLRLTFSTETSEIVRLWPFPPPQNIEQRPDDQPKVGEGNFLGRYEIYNEETGRSVYTGPMLLAAFLPGTCPRGERYD